MVVESSTRRTLQSLIFPSETAALCKIENRQLCNTSTPSWLNRLLLAHLWSSESDDDRRRKTPSGFWSRLMGANTPRRPLIPHLENSFRHTSMCVILIRPTVEKCHFAGGTWSVSAPTPSLSCSSANSFVRDLQQSPWLS